MKPKFLNKKIHIPEPCNADWQNMTRDKNGRFCGTCQKVVVDFSHKTLEEIKIYFSNSGGKQICGRYQERHTNVANKWFSSLNNIELTLSKLKLQRLSVFLIAALLFLTGCYRHVQGRRLPYTVKKKNKHKQEDTRVSAPDSILKKPQVH